MSAADIKPAATILLLRDDPSFEVLMVKRHHQIDFASGALVFPGGKTHAGDHDPAWADHTTGWEHFDAEQRGLRIAAIREVFEEAGILLASGPGGALQALRSVTASPRRSSSSGTYSATAVRSFIRLLARSSPSETIPARPRIISPIDQKAMPSPYAGERPWCQ